MECGSLLPLSRCMKLAPAQTTSAMLNSPTRRLSHPCAILVVQTRATPLPIPDAPRLRPELRLLHSLSLHRQHTLQSPRHDFPRPRPNRSLFRPPRTLPRPEHRPVSRPLRFHVPLRLAPGPHLPCPRVLPSPAFRGRVRPPLHPCLFPGRPPPSRRPPSLHARARYSFRPARNAQHSGLRRLRLILRPQPHLSRREPPPAQSQTRRSSLAPSPARSPRAHEPFQRPHRPDLHRRRHHPRLHLGRPPYRPILVLRSQVRGHPPRTRTLCRLSPALAYHNMARRQSLPALHLQFRSGNPKFHGGEPISLAHPPLFLKVVVVASL